MVRRFSPIYPGSSTLRAKKRPNEGRCWLIRHWAKIPDDRLFHHLREKPRGLAQDRERGLHSGPDEGLKALEILDIPTA